MKPKIYLFVITVLFTAVMVSCKETNVTDVKLNKTELTLDIGQTETLVVTVLPKDADNTAVSWKSSNATVVMVDNNGLVTAKAEGTAIVTATAMDGNKMASCAVTVKDSIDPDPETITEPEMIFVEGGTFMFGCTDDECDLLDEYSIEQLAVEKTVSSFYISKYPVTQKLWREVMGSPPRNQSYGVGDDYPVYGISYLDIFNFMIKLRSATGKNYSVPSAIEWEYAARGGNQSQGYKYSGSNNLDEVAWYSENSNNSTHPVGEKWPNELGIYDMSGNVKEWVADEYLAGGSAKPEIYQIRSGSWRGGSSSCRVSSCSVAMSTNIDPTHGFRLILIVP